jgi:hypothetical protein
MGKVVLGMTMSLDGFINDRAGSVARLYPDLGELRNMPSLQETIKNTGAVVMGRRAFEMGDPDAYADHYEFDEIHIDIMPVLFGGGLCLFDHVNDGIIDLKKITGMDFPIRTHLRFRVLLQ